MKIVNRIMPLLLVCTAISTTLPAQDPKTSGADTSANKSDPKITDEGFLKSGIKQQIIDIQLAQLALKKGSKPRVQQTARQIISDGRENLRELLKISEGKNIEGVSKQEIDAVMNDVLADSMMNASDPRAAATSGNTVTDSLGSGSSGSGNVGGRDTGTLVRARTNGNANYSAQGDYAYNNNLFMNEAEVLETAQGKDFDSKWVQLMLRIHQGKVDHYNKAAARIQDLELKQAVGRAIPRIRMHNSTLLRLSKNRDVSDGHDNDRQGGGNQGAGK